MKRTRRKFSPEFKTKVVLEALKEQSTLQELSSKFEIHQNQISQWKKEFLSSASSVFSKSKVAKSNEKDVDDLYKKIGKIQVENDFLREVLGK